MRFCFLLLVAISLGFASRAAAAPRPLSSREVSLMLRAGYSSESILQDITQRRLVDAPDPAAEKALREFGASPQLFEALTSGRFRVDAAAAERARQAEAAALTSQQLLAEKNAAEAAAVQRKQQAAAAAATPPPIGLSLAKLLQNKLVRCRDGTISPAEAGSLESKKLIALYFSAHWCAPCRKFTPELVDYYQRAVTAHPEFEIIFISSDKSRFNWETYMRDTKMPWLAIDFDQLGAFANLKQLGGESIPSLLVLDAQGRMVASSYEGERYVGPRNALAQLEKLFASPAVAQTR